MKVEGDHFGFAPDHLLGCSKSRRLLRQPLAHGGQLAARRPENRRERDEKTRLPGEGDPRPDPADGPHEDGCPGGGQRQHRAEQKLDGHQQEAQHDPAPCRHCPDRDLLHPGSPACPVVPV